MNPRRIGRAVGISRAWANVGYQDPLYYCLVQIGVPAVTIYAFDNRIDAVLNCGDAVLASGEGIDAADDVLELCEGRCAFFGARDSYTPAAKEVYPDSRLHGAAVVPSGAELASTRAHSQRPLDRGPVSSLSRKPACRRTAQN